MTTPPTGRPTPPTERLIAAMADVLAFCDEHPGFNLPDLLSVALTEVAYQHGGTDALTRHRPGCWEASHVQALAAGADHRLFLDHEQQERPY